MTRTDGVMKPQMGLFAAVLTLPLLSGCGQVAPAEAESPPPAGPRVELVRLPSGGYQPQAAVDSRGAIHVVYVQGAHTGADLFYTRREGDRWSTPLRVGKPGTAVPAGTIRGPQLALGRSDRVHVVWFGSAGSGFKGPEGSAPLLYARLNEAGTAFEPERNLMQATTALDGGPGIAADRKGNVLVAWQAGERKGQGESDRRLWVARSSDDGKTFSRETSAWDEPTGACPCCSTEAFADSKGNVYAMYRMAANGSERDMVLLASTDRGRTFRGVRIDAWPVNT